MRFFHVSSAKGVTALIYHNYLDGQYYCRSRSDSFRRAFDEVCGKILRRFCKENRNLHVYSFGPGDYGWIDAVLADVCQGEWVFKELGKDEIAGSFDDMVDKFLPKS